jgi:hypothetical protein
MSPQLWTFEDYSTSALTDASITSLTFDRSHGQMTLNVIVNTSNTCKMIMSKILLDGAFNLVVDEIPSNISVRWSRQYSMLEFTMPKGNHTIRIVGEHSNGTSNYWPQLLSFPDINGDGQINILDITIVAKNFGRKLNP